MWILWALPRWSHLTEALRKIITEQPDNVIDYFEEFSRKIKQERLVLPDTLKDVYVPSPQLESAKNQLALVSVCNGWVYCSNHTLGRINIKQTTIIHTTTNCFIYPLAPWGNQALSKHTTNHCRYKCWVLPHRGVWACSLFLSLASSAGWPSLSKPNLTHSIPTLWNMWMSMDRLCWPNFHCRLIRKW